MPDPLTVTAAITLAGKAVNQVSKLVQSGREIERLGWFNPISESNSYSIKEELILKWLKDGAIPSDSVKSLFKRIGLSYKWHLMNEGKSEQEINKGG